MTGMIEEMRELERQNARLRQQLASSQRKTKLWFQEFTKLRAVIRDAAETAKFSAEANRDNCPYSDQHNGLSACVVCHYDPLHGGSIQ